VSGIHVFLFVIPAKAGIHEFAVNVFQIWIPDAAACRQAGSNPTIRHPEAAKQPKDLAGFRTGSVAEGSTA